MFNLVPFAGARWEVAHGDRQLEFIRQVLQLVFSQTEPVSIAAATIGRDQQTLDLGLVATPFGAPPTSNGCHGELPRIVIRPDDDVTRIVR